jgi:hypothetical protein
MGLDHARTQAPRHVTHATYPARGVGAGRLRQDPAPGITLEHLRRDWGASYTLSEDGPPYTGCRAGGQPVTAATLEGFQMALMADWSRYGCPLTALEWDAR